MTLNVEPGGCPTKVGRLYRGESPFADVRQPLLCRRHLGRVVGGQRVRVERRVLGHREDGARARVDGHEGAPGLLRGRQLLHGEILQLRRHREHDVVGLLVLGEQLAESVDGRLVLLEILVVAALDAVLVRLGGRLVCPRDAGEVPRGRLRVPAQPVVGVMGRDRLGEHLPVGAQDLPAGLEVGVDLLRARGVQLVPVEGRCLPDLDVVQLHEQQHEAEEDQRPHPADASLHQ